MKATLALALVAVVAFASGLLAQSPPMGGYTNADYMYGTTYGMYASNVVFKRGTTTLASNSSGASSSPYNTFFSSVGPALLLPSQTHTVEVTIQGGYACYVSIFVDSNNDGDFLDSGELLGSSGVINSGATGTISFVPVVGVGGTQRFRLRTNYSPYGAPTHPTSQQYYGEAEDYLVNLGFSITTNSPLPTAAQGTAYSTTILATNGTTPYTWQGTGYIWSGSLPPGLSATPQGSPNFGLVISGTPTTTGVYNFTVRVIDSKTPTPDSSQKDFSITVVPPPAALPFFDDFSTFKGWQLGTTWQRAPAVAYTASSPPREEPGTDYTPGTTDNYILGDNIGGNYAANQSVTHWAVSPLVNCSGATSVRLSFWRFMGIALDCPANGGGTIQVSNNGVNWTTVWQTVNGTTYKDNAWTSVYYDLTAQAAGYPTVQVRFGIGPTGATLHTGWCIDDLKIEQPGPDLVVRAGSLTGTQLTDNQAATGPLDFGQVNTSTNSAPLNLYFINQGPANITFGTISKTGAQPNDFYVNASSFLYNLPVGQYCVLTITFYRTTIGISTGTVNVPHNATGSGTSPWEFNLRGEAITPNPDIQVRLGSVTGPVITHNQSATGTPRDFGNWDINAGPSAAITIFIINSGTGQLNISTPDMGGTWWNQFVVDTTGMLSGLTAGQSTSFTIRFDPSSVGSKDAYARIAHTDTGQPSPFYVPVLGNGTTSSVPDMVVHEGSATGPALTHNQTASGGRAFGNQLVAAGPTPALDITIENTGGVALTLGMPTLGGLNPTEFILDTTNFQTSVNSGSTTVFSVAFDPSSVGPKAAQITFTHNVSGITSPFIINVSGSGVNVAPIITVRETSATGTQLTNPAPATGILNFGTRDVNAGPSAAAIIYVENTGTAPLTLGSPFFSPATTEFQLQSTGFAQTLAVGASATFSIIFDPTVAANPVNAQIRFTHNDAGTGSPFVLNVTGIATLNAPKLEVREGSFIGNLIAHDAAPVPGVSRDLGSIDVNSGNTLPLVIVIMNTGNLAMTVGMPVLGGTNSGDFTLNTGGFTTNIPAGGMTQFDLVFDPALAGIKDCTVTFTHNDPGQTSPFIVRFMGTGTDPNSVKITTPDLPPALSSVAYTFNMQANQGVAPYTWSIYSGNLPAGLSMNSLGQITGSPSGFGSINDVVIRVQDATGATDEKSYTVIVQRDPSSGKAGSSSCAVGAAGALPAVLGLLGLGLVGARRRRK
ncbi:MAG: choice-of-anchor D domain-containing protein [Planctomycetes bacterium]|jgi:MYXO-CTERM domain-containing protein|nr:choice-of-anchor D domain-containing protein [Planctomycetota bacterium]MCL4729210.1 choice-of-anchor D domain-containing protein [Planctomycetota bacterium]